MVPPGPTAAVGQHRGLWVAQGLHGPPVTASPRPSHRREPGGGAGTFVTIIHLIEFQLARAGDGGSHRVGGRGELVVFHVAENNFQGSG